MRLLATLAGAACIWGSAASAAVFQFTAGPITDGAPIGPLVITLTADDALVATGQIDGTLRCNPATGCTASGSWNLVSLTPDLRSLYLQGDVHLAFIDGLPAGRVGLDDGLDGEWLIDGDHAAWGHGNVTAHSTGGVWAVANPAAVPEPAGVGLLGAGLLALALIRSYSRRSL